MAKSNKIGAYIVLDGEAQFKQDVTSCNKALTALKSEMALVKEESKGQEDSLESLRKTHEVLERTLDAHKQKEEAINAGLKNADASYKKVGDQLDEYRKKLESASERLIQMQNDSSTTEEELEEQKKVVEDLTLIVTKGEMTYKKAGDRVKEWNTKLNSAKTDTLKANRALKENEEQMENVRKAAEEAAKSEKECADNTKECTDNTEKYNEKTKEAVNVTMDLSDVLKVDLCENAIEMTKEGLRSLTESITDLESVQKQLQASTGLTTEEMERYNASMQTLYMNNYGENLEDISNSMALVKQYTNAIDPTVIEEMTENGIAMQDVFNIDLSESIRGVDAMMDSFGMTSSRAFDLMAKGAQNGLDKSGELADNLTEYSQLYAQAGFQAEEMFAIMENGLTSGAYNLGKVNDFVKEFGNSLADGRIEDNLESFSQETQTLFGKWQNGKATTRDVFYSVINDLGNATNQQKMLTLASNTWSSLGEDNALKVITSLNKVNDSYGDVKGTMEDIKEIKYDTLESRIQTLGRKVITEFVQPLAQEYLPAVEEGLDKVIDNTDTLIPLTVTAVSSMITYKTAQKAITMYEAAVKLATASQGIFNAVMAANPAAVIAVAVAAAGTAMVLFGEDTERASEETKQLIDESVTLREEVDALTETMKESKTEWKETAASMETQKTTADALVDELYALERQGNETTEGQQRMRQIVSELNEMFPELSLALNDETYELDKNQKSVKKSIEASLAYQKVKAAEAKLADISEELVEAELKKSEAEKKSAEIEKQLKSVREELNSMEVKGTEIIDSYGNVISSASEEEKRLREEEAKLVYQLKQSKEGLGELQNTYDDLSDTYGTIEDYMNNQIETSEKMAESYSEVSEAANESVAVQQEAMETLAEQITETYSGIKASIEEVLESQMDMFSKFDQGTKLSTTELLENMQSQIDGVTNWADNMAVLADRGINGNLLTYLSELGPEGAGYVATFAEMTDAELERANEMWEKSLDMKEGVNDSVQGMIESYTEALNGGKEKVQQATAEIGGGTIQGLVDEMNRRKGEVEAVGNDIGSTATDSVAEGADTHSPSKKTEKTGGDIVDGLILGVHKASAKAVTEVETFSQNIVKKIDTDIDSSKFKKTGQNIVDGITSGINSKKTVALSAAKSLASGVYKNASSVGSLYSVGYNMSKGMATGILAGRSEVINATASVCAAAVQKAKSDLQIHSPSKVFEKIGRQMAEGQGIGYKKGISELNAMIAESLKLPNADSYHAGNNAINGYSLNDIKKTIGQAVMEGFGNAAKKTQFKVYIGTREFDRGLRDRGVVYL